MKSLITSLMFGTAAMALAGSANAKILPVEDDPGAVHSYILLDRTGSMSDIWEEALGSVNAYAASVGEADEGEVDGADIETDVTLASSSVTLCQSSAFTPSRKTSNCMPS